MHTNEIQFHRLRQPRLVSTRYTYTLLFRILQRKSERLSLRFNIFNNRILLLRMTIDSAYSFDVNRRARARDFKRRKPVSRIVSQLHNIFVTLGYFSFDDETCRYLVKLFNTVTSLLTEIKSRSLRDYQSYLWKKSVMSRSPSAITINAVYLIGRIYSGISEADCETRTISSSMWTRAYNSRITPKAIRRKCPHL